MMMAGSPGSRLSRRKARIEMISITGTGCKKLAVGLIERVVSGDMRKCVEHRPPLLGTQNMIWPKGRGRQVPVAGALLHMRGVGGPIGDLNVDVDSGSLELLGDNQHGGSHPLVIAVGLDNDLLVVVSGLLEEFPGFRKV